MVLKKLTAIITAIILLAVQSPAYALGEDTAYRLSSEGPGEWGIIAQYSADAGAPSSALPQSLASNSTYEQAVFLMASKAVGRDVSATAGLIKRSQMKNGKLADFTDGTGEKSVRAHIWGIIALYSAWDNGYDKSSALRWLKTKQNSDGGFGYEAGKPSDIKTTSEAVLAFKALGIESEEAAARALAYVESKLPAEKNGEKLAWAFFAKHSMGKDDQKLYERLRSYELPDGSYSLTSTNKTYNYAATCAALLALKEYENGYSVFKKLHNADMFKDLRRGDYAYSEVMELVNRDIASGYPDSTFRPNLRVTRAEFAKFLVYALGYENSPARESITFKDLEEHWAEKIVYTAVGKKLINGIGKGMFAPDQNVTGAQIVAMLVRAKGLEGIAARFEGAKWYDGYVSAAIRRGLIYEGFDPETNATRAQCAKALSKLY